MGFWKRLFGDKGRETRSNTAPGTAAAPLVASRASDSRSTSPSKKIAAQTKYEQGMALFTSDQKREGLLCFVEATGLDPDCLDAHIALGRAFHVLKKRDMALQYAQSAIRIAPQDDRAKNVMVIALQGVADDAFEEKDWPTAYEWYKRALLANPTDVDATNIFHLLGAVWQDADMGEDFVALCHELLRQNPSDNSRRFKLGMALIKLSRYAEALPVCVEYVDRDQVCAKGRWQLGIAYVANGNIEAAEVEYKILQRLDPEKAADLRTWID